MVVTITPMELDTPENPEVVQISPKSIHMDVVTLLGCNACITIPDPTMQVKAFMLRDLTKSQQKRMFLLKASVSEP